jgi:hypothetical protein
MRLPRKLKKGCRTLKGRPRTKWQRKVQLQKKRLLENITNTACAAAVGMELLRQAAKKINPVTFPSGGIVVPPPKVGVAQMSTGEMVVAREQVGVLKATIKGNSLQHNPDAVGYISGKDIVKAIDAYLRKR